MASLRDRAAHRLRLAANRVAPPDAAPPEPEPEPEPEPADPILLEPPEVRELVAPVGLDEEPALVAEDLRLDQPDPVDPGLNSLESLHMAG